MEITTVLVVLYAIKFLHLGKVDFQKYFANELIFYAFKTASHSQSLLLVFQNVIENHQNKEK